jgi:hypothetical protein
MNGSLVAGEGDTAAQADSSWTIQGAGDFDGDGRFDILWRHTLGALSLWQMQGTALKAARSLPLIGLAWTIKGLGDFNGDWKSDILWRERDSGKACEWLMDGSQVAGGGLTGSWLGNSWVIEPRGRRETRPTRSTSPRFPSGATSCLPSSPLR